MLNTFYLVFKLINKRTSFNSSWTLHICKTTQLKRIIPRYTLSSKRLFLARYLISIHIYCRNTGQTMANLSSASFEFSQLRLLNFYNVGRNWSIVAVWKFIHPKFSPSKVMQPGLSVHSRQRLDVFTMSLVSRQEFTSQTRVDNPTDCLSHWFLFYFSVNRLYSYLCRSGKNIPPVSLNSQQSNKKTQI